MMTMNNNENEFDKYLAQVSYFMNSAKMRYSKEADLREIKRIGLLYKSYIQQLIENKIINNDTPLEYINDLINSSDVFFIVLDSSARTIENVIFYKYIRNKIQTRNYSCAEEMCEFMNMSKEDIWYYIKVNFSELNEIKSKFEIMHKSITELFNAGIFKFQGERRGSAFEPIIRYNGHTPIIYKKSEEANEFFEKINNHKYLKNIIQYNKINISN